MPPPKPPTPTLLRCFSTTHLVCKTVASLSRTRMPPYPYGPTLQYKQANSGLYGGSTIQFGNRVSSKNEIKTRRAWRPNIHQKRLWSDALQKFISVKVQARVLRTIDKVGGLDSYLLGDKPARIKELGVEGWRLRWKVLRSPSVRRRIGEERVRLGVPVEGYVSPLVVPDGEGKEEGGVQGEVERVSGDIVEQMEWEDKEEDQFAPEDGGETLLEREQKDETMEERVARTSRNIERFQGNQPEYSKSAGGQSIDAQEHPHRLVRTKQKGDEERFNDDARTEQARAARDEPDVVQANDARSMFSKLRGMLRR